MRFHLKKSINLGPIRLNFTQRGLSSISLHAGRITLNSRTRRTTVDTPGPGWVSFGEKGRR